MFKRTMLDCVTNMANNNNPYQEDGVSLRGAYATVSQNIRFTVDSNTSSDKIFYGSLLWLIVVHGGP